MKVLVAEDDLVTRRLLEATLRKWGYEVIAVGDGEAAERVLTSGEARLAVCDWVLPRLSAPELCRRVRQSEEGSFVYIIILSAKDRKQDLIEGIKAGADDYVTKPFDRQELEVRLRAGQRLLELQQDLLDAQVRLTRMATHDSLTGLWNHQAILDVLEREFARHRREGRPLAAAMADVDHFKRVNDTWGHPVGDAVLAQIGERAVGAVRPYDSVGRYGGEEFMLVLPGCDSETGRNVAERVRLAVSRRVLGSGAGPVSVTLSIGVAATDAVEASCGADLVSAADAALYRAKQQGRNLSVCAEPAC